MHRARHARVSELFATAIEMPTEQWAPFLEKACGDDHDLRREVQELLARDQRSAVVDRPIVDATLSRAVLDDSFDTKEIPRKIGPYQIIEEIGRGGMGTVYKARQQNPNRVVALKVVHAHLNSKTLARRIEYEAQVLACLQHEGIAQIIEAGAATVSGVTLPYFALELIDGYVLTEHAERNQLDLRERLDLIIRVSAAVQHAHRQGVIHRDLKPANVLVTTDGQPKILDFGIARVTDPQLKSTTLQTIEGQLVGTVAYMSPEQARGDYASVDTRSDVYALGVLTFELLTGRLPYDIFGKPIAEAARIILDAAPHRLGQFNPTCQGDLETIINKALAKDQDMRYESAAAFAADIRRYLGDEPIIARPASLTYQLRKFAQRNRGLVAATVAALVLLVAAIAGTSYGLIKATRQRDEAIKAQEALMIAKEATEKESEKVVAVNTFLGRMLSAAYPLGDVAEGRRDMTIIEMLDSESGAIAETFKDQPAIESALRTTIGMIYEGLGRYDDAYEHLTIARKLHRQTAGENSDDAIRAERDIAGVLARMGRMDEAVAMFRSAYERQKSRDGESGMEYAISASRLGLALGQNGQLEEAQQMIRRALDAMEKSGAADDELYARTTNNLAMILSRLNQPKQAEVIYRKARAALAQIHGPEHASVGITENNIARMLQKQGNLAGAAEGFGRAVDILRKSLGPQHPEVATIINNLGALYGELGELQKSVQVTREALDIYRNTVGEDHPDYITTLNNLAYSLFDAGDFAEAAPAFDSVSRFYVKQLGAQHYRTLIPQVNWARSIAHLGRIEEAESTMTRVVDQLTNTRGVNDRFTQMAVRATVRFCMDQKDSVQARRFRSLLSPENPASADLLNETAAILADQDID